MRQLFLSILVILLFNTTSLSAQSLQKELVNYCLNSDVKTLLKQLKKLEKRKDIIFDNFAYHIDYEIIDDFHAQLFEIKHTEKENANLNRISIYRLRIIEKDNQLIFYEIDKGFRNQKDIWTTKTLIIRHCGTSLFNELIKKYENLYDIKLETLPIFNTDFLYYIPLKIDYYNCSFYKKREILITAVEQKNTTQLLTWLKSGNVPLQLYAIEGIFQLTEKGVSFPPNTWNWIQLVQKKEGNVRTATGCGSEKFPIYTLVQQIKGRYGKARRKVKQAANS